MSTSTIDLGFLLSQLTREHNEPARTRARVSTAPKVEASKGSGQASAAEKAEENSQLQRAQLSEALERASRLDRRLTFKVDEDSGKSVVVVRDARTLEVLKQFPSEEMLNVARRLEEHLRQSGAGAGVLHTDEV